MIQQLAETLAQQIREAELVTLAGGLATVWKSNDKEKKSKAAYWNYQDETHEFLAPDADKKAITYFEEVGNTRITTQLTGKYRAELVLIGWVNTTTDILTPVLIEELQQVFKRPFSAGLFTSILVEFTDLLPENEQLFSRYQYDTAIRKYLQKPYDAFGLRMVVTFNVNTLC